MLYSALEPFEADNRSRMFYRVTVSPAKWSPASRTCRLGTARCRTKGPYAALVDFYDDRYRGEPVRVAVLLQPVAGRARHGDDPVAETLELRQTLARQILFDTLWRQALVVL